MPARPLFESDKPREYPVGTGPTAKPRAGLPLPFRPRTVPGGRSRRRGGPSSASGGIDLGRSQSALLTYSAR